VAPQFGVAYDECYPPPERRRYQQKNLKITDLSTCDQRVDAFIADEKSVYQYLSGFREPLLIAGYLSAPSRS
jgi:hypothetical protein